MAKKKTAKSKTKAKRRPPTATFVFLNCQHLEYLENQQEPTEKIKDLAATLRLAAGGNPPAVFGLSEVHDVILVQSLAETVAPHTYAVIMSTPKTEPMGVMGLALCYNKELLAEADVVRDRPRRPALKSRSYWLATQLRFQKRSKASIWIILTHWKSLIGGDMETELTRIDNFREVEELFRATSDLHGLLPGAAKVMPVIKAGDPVIIAGDFNCEPGSRPLNVPTRAEGIEVCRHLGSVAGVPRNRARFLNTMWSAMATDNPDKAGFKHGTYDHGEGNFGPRMFDQILVSRVLVEEGSPVKYVPHSTRIQATPPTASDHSAVAASLEY